MSERGSKTSTVPVVWATLEFFRFGAIQIISCRTRLMTMDETWLYHYDPETKQQSMEWRLSVSSRPKNIRVQKSTGKVLASNFLGIQTACFSLITFQRAKLSTRSITHLCWCNWRIFWSSPRWSCSCTTMPRLTGHLQPRRNWPTWASSILTTHPILRIWPRRTTTYSLDWKKQMKNRHFWSDADVIAASEIRLDGQYFEVFFWVACKS